MHYFVTGIDTDSGKTLVSAILCEALSADYWKPVQAGSPRDADTVRQLISNSQTRIHDERFQLSLPASPHAAAKADGIDIRLDDFTLPASGNRLVIEGAGGCLVPLNDKDFMIDLITRLRADVIVVADLYLGSINHTLLTMEALKARRVSVRGLVFNGEQNDESERIILRHTQLPCLLRIAREPVINQDVVSRYAEILNRNLDG